MYTDFKLDKNKILLGEKVYLRPISIDDSKLIVKWRNQEDVRKFFFYREDFTLQNQRKWYELKVNGGEVYQFVVCENSTDEPIGCTYLQDYESTTNCAESGIFLGASDIRGKGYGKDALLLTVRFAFEELGLDKLMARAIADNKASISTHLSVGYKIVEHTKQQIIPGGEIVDTVMMEIVNE